MIKKQDIQKAITIFKEWDNKRQWEKPSNLFISHTYKKAEDSLNTAKALYNLMSDDDLRKKALPGAEYDSCLWAINSAYYSMFFLSQALLGKEGRKLPEGTKDTHQAVFLAMLYYFIIKGSGLEGKKCLEWEEIKSSRMSDALIIFQQSKEEAEGLLQVKRAKEAIDSLKNELNKRTELTYRTTRNAEMSFAKTSIERAEMFWQIIKEYAQARNQPARQ